jgi:hypothetical protein
MKRIPEPEPDAPLWVWSIYFDDRLQMIREDLKAEGTTLERVLAEMRRRWRDERRARWHAR